MPLVPGTRLGPYEIAAQIGVGGMGEVYRAIDTSLKRQVAIKVLPDAVAFDTERLARLQREAQIFASLNHPNIARVYGLEESDGTRALVMELVEGPTLADRIAKGAIPVAEALRIAKQTAEALEAAHEQGIVHRDLKPANIKLTRTGDVKVLDFGLAKLATSGASAANIPPHSSMSTTVTSPAMLTRHGIILGTATYMSPEQARGREVDRRADIWAFGCVLYEMLTGRRAFDGDGVTDVLARIIERDVDWSALPAATPIAVRRLLRRCLAKTPSDRQRDAGDIVIEINEAIAEPAAPPASLQPRKPGPRRFAGELKAAAAGVALLAIGAAAAYRWTGRDRAGNSQRYSMEKAEIVQLTSSGRAERPAISPDGKYVVYVEREGTNFSLRLRQTITTSTAQIVPAEPGVRIWGATVTPDGAFVDYVRDGAAPGMPELWRVPLLGGSGRRLLSPVHSNIMWSPDGRQFAFIRRDNSPRRDLLMVGDGDTFTTRVIADSRDGVFLSLATLSALVRPPAWSPDGRRLAVAVGQATKDVLLVVNADGTGERAFVIPGADGLFGHAWLGDDELVLNVLTSQGSPTQLWHYSLADSSARRLTHDVNGFLGVDVSADRRTWVTSRSDIRVSLWIGDSRGSHGEEVVSPMLYNYIVVERARLTWAGKHVIFNAASTRPASKGGPSYRIGAFRVTPPDSTTLEILPSVSDFVGTPNADALIFSKICGEPCPPGDAGLWRSDLDGGNASMLVPGDVDVVMTADGRHLIYGKQANNVVTPWIVEFGGGKPRQISDREGTPVDVTRDGKRLLLNSPAGQMMCELPACVEPTPAPRVGPARRWLPDGSGIAYLDAARSNIWVRPLGGGTAYQLTGFTGGRQIGDYRWSHDGLRLAVTLVSTPTDVVLLKGLQP